MADITIANYRLQAYLLANAQEIIERVGRNRKNTRFQTQLSTAQSKPGDNPQPCFTKKAVLAIVISAINHLQVIN